MHKDTVFHWALKRAAATCAGRSFYQNIVCVCCSGDAVCCSAHKPFHCGLILLIGFLILLR